MITTDNYECYFFQYQEGMLDEAARCEVERFATAHPDLAEELALYAEAPRLQAESVAMPHKEQLRRHLPVAWWRYAAAAAVIAAVAVTCLLTLRQPALPEVPKMVAQFAQTSEAHEVLEQQPSQSPAGATQASASTAAAVVVKTSIETAVLPAPLAQEEALAEAAPIDPADNLPAVEAVAPEAAQPGAAPIERVTIKIILVDDMIAYIDTPQSLPEQPAEPLEPTIGQQVQQFWHIASILYPLQTDPINNAKARVEETAESTAPLLHHIEILNQFLAKIF